MYVAVGTAVIVPAGVTDAMPVDVWSGRDVAGAVDGRAVTGRRVGLVESAPGVRKMSIQTGCVRMDGSMGSMKPPGRLVRKPLFGSRLDSMLESSFQLGLRRSAHPQQGSSVGYSWSCFQCFGISPRRATR